MDEMMSWMLIFPPWIVLLFLDGQRVKRFLSVAFFTFMINVLHFQMADVWNWWTVTANVPFFGANIAMDAFQSFVVSPFVFEKYGLYKMENMTNLGLFLLILSILPIIYLYQLWYDHGIHYKSSSISVVQKLPFWLRRRKKAR